MATQPRPPVMVSSSVTRKRSLRCLHCYSESVGSPHPSELSTDEAKRVIPKVAATGAGAGDQPRRARAGEPRRISVGGLAHR